MAMIRTTCLLCEDAVDVHAEDVTLHLEGTTEDADNRYGFTCPVCTVYVVRPANGAVVDALLAEEVPLSTGPVAPWEVVDDMNQFMVVDAGPHPEAVVNEDLPPLTDADVAAFLAELEATDHLAALVG